MHCRHVEFHTFQYVRQLFGFQFRRREDNGFRIFGLSKHLAYDAQLLALVADVCRLRNRLVGFRNGNRNLSRVVQNRTCQLADLRRERCREHNRLALFGQIRNDLHNVVAETHIEHTVGLVKDQTLDVRQIDTAICQMGDQATRSCNHHIGAHQHTAFLHLPALAVATAIDDGSRYGQEVRKTLKLHIDLLRQLARGYDDERLDHIVGVALDRQAVEQGEGIGGSFARTRLCATNYITSREYHRYGMLLNGRHLDEVHCVQTIEHFGFKF